MKPRFAWERTRRFQEEHIDQKSSWKITNCCSAVTLGRILTLAIADRDAIVRKTAIAASKPPFDRDLASE